VLRIPVNRDLVVIAVLAGIAAVASSSASSAPQRVPARLGTAQGSLVSDGARYVLSQPAQRILRVLDFRTGRRVDIPLNDSCELQAMATKGPALLNCTIAGRPVTRLFFPAARAVRDLPGAVTASSYSSIGRYWAAGSTATPNDPNRPQDVYTNWRTGQQVFVGWPLPPQPQTSFRDADTRGLTALPKGDVPELHARAGRYLLHSQRGVLTLEDGRRSMPVTFITGSRPQLTSRAITWSDAEGAHALLLSSRKRRLWRNTDETRSNVPVVQVGHYVVYGTGTGLESFTTRLHAARLR
jgi:hypothetical protein